LNIPVFTFAAYSNVGKTTYLEKLIPCLKKAGLKVAVIKHDCHEIQLDIAGKDTERLKKAGANPVTIASKTGVVYFEDGEVTLKDCLMHIRDVDLILTEGFKNEEFPKIAIYREASGQPLAVEDEKCFAIISDVSLDVPCPLFPLEDPIPFSDFLNNFLKNPKKENNASSSRISVEQATELVLSKVHQLEKVNLPLCESLGSIISSDIFAPVMQPPFNRSPLDGYAVCAADIARAKLNQPVVLEVIDRIIAGDKALMPVRSGQAVRVMTGSMIPEGADYIVRQEDTDLGEKFVKIFKSGTAGKNYCYAGEEYCVGDLLIAAGTKADAAAIAVASGAGFTELPVTRRPKVAILSTGNEVQLPGSPLEAAKVYDVNSAYLAARAAEFGAAVSETYLVSDDRQLIGKTLCGCLGNVDVILSTGGVSVGEMDLMEQVLLDIQAEILYHGLDIKPGMPTMAAVKDETLIIALSGNPFAATVPFELLVRPVLAKMRGDYTFRLQRDVAIAKSSFSKASPTRRFLRGYVDKDGLVQMPDAQANGQMRSMIGCNCLIDVPSGCPGIKPGDWLKIIRL